MCIKFTEKSYFWSCTSGLRYLAKTQHYDSREFVEWRKVGIIAHISAVSPPVTGLKKNTPGSPSSSECCNDDVMLCNVMMMQYYFCMMT